MDGIDGRNSIDRTSWWKDSFGWASVLGGSFVGSRKIYRRCTVLTTDSNVETLYKKNWNQNQLSLLPVKGTDANTERESTISHFIRNQFVNEWSYSKWLFFSVLPYWWSWKIRRWIWKMMVVAVVRWKKATSCTKERRKTNEKSYCRTRSRYSLSAWQLIVSHTTYPVCKDTMFRTCEPWHPRQVCRMYQNPK